MPEHVSADADGSQNEGNQGDIKQSTHQLTVLCIQDGSQHRCEPDGRRSRPRAGRLPYRDLHAATRDETEQREHDDHEDDDQYE